MMYLRALKLVETGHLTADALDDWAHEIADSLEWVVYFDKAMALFASGVGDDEDYEAAAAALDERGRSADDRILDAVYAFSCSWHRRILAETARVHVTAERD